jgi:hypothetical protein
MRPLLQPIKLQTPSDRYWNNGCALTARLSKWLSGVKSSSKAPEENPIRLSPSNWVSIDTPAGFGESAFRPGPIDRSSLSEFPPRTRKCSTIAARQIIKRVASICMAVDAGYNRADLPPIVILDFPWPFALLGHATELKLARDSI